MDVSAAIRNLPWAITPAAFNALLEKGRAGRLLSGEPAAVLRRGAAIGANNQPNPRIAVLPLLGVLSQRSGPMDFGDTSLEAFGAVFDQVLRGPSIDSIVIEVDSLGGGVYGVDELAARIFAARGRKRVVAVANSLAASAAYWIGTAAAEFVVTPAGEVGSIGVFAVHMDWSRAEEMAGIGVTMISAGKYKTEGNEHEPLGDTARTALERRVGQYHEMFVAAVARHRGASQTDVRYGFGEGRVVGADDALRMRMVDRVETIDQTLARLGGAGKLQTSANARAGFENEIEIARARLRDARARVAG